MSMFNAGLVLSLTDNLSGPLGAVQRRYERFGGAALAQADRIEAAGRQAMRAGARTAALGAAVLAPFAGAGAAFASFDSAMTQSTAIMDGLTEAQDRQLRATALQTAGAFSATELGGAYYYLASAGLSAEQQVGALGRVSRFATAGQFDLARATDLLTDAQSALGMVSKDAVENQAAMSRVSDVLVRANTLANASVEQFSTALTNGVGAAARAAGKDVEEVTGTLAVLADQGLKGEAAGTALTGVLQMLPKVATKNADSFRRLGIEVFDAGGNLRALPDIVDSMTAAFGDMSDAERAAAYEELQLNRQLGDTVTQLLGTGDQMRRYEGALRDAAGATDEVAERQGKALIPTLNRVKNRLGVLGISIVQNYSGPLAAAAAWTERFVDRLIGWTERHPRLTAAVVATSAAVGALLVVGGGALVLFGALASGAASAVRAVTMMRAATALAGVHFRIAARRARLFAVSQGLASSQSVAGAGALRSFAVAARGAVAALATNPLAWGLVAGAFLVWKYWRPIKAFLAGVWEGLVAGVRPVLQEFDGVFSAVRPLVDAVGRFLGTLLRQSDPSAQALGRVASAGRVVGSVLAFFVRPAVGGIAVALRVLNGVLSVAPDLFRAVRSTVRLAFDVGPLGLFLNTARGLFRAVRTLVTGGGWREAGRQLVMSIAGGIRSAAGALVESVRGVFARLRRMVPGSPVREGPLTAFNSAGRGLMELAASTVTPRPLQRALESAFSSVRAPALAAGLAVATSAAGAPPAAAAGRTDTGPPISLTVHVTVPAGTAPEVRSAAEAGVAASLPELRRLILETVDERDRLAARNTFRR